MKLKHKTSIAQESWEFLFPVTNHPGNRILVFVLLLTPVWMTSIVIVSLKSTAMKQLIQGSPCHCLHHRSTWQPRSWHLYADFETLPHISQSSENDQVRLWCRCITLINTSSNNPRFHKYILLLIASQFLTSFNKHNKFRTEYHHLNPPTNFSNMGFFRSTGNFFGSKTKQHSANVSKEANKRYVEIRISSEEDCWQFWSIAKDPHAPADARLRAGFRGLGDTFKQHRNGREAAAHKHAAKHGY